MRESSSTRPIGILIFCVGVFLVVLNVYLALKRGEFYGIASFLGPVAGGYGLSVMLRPPPQLPQTTLAPYYQRFLGVGAAMGLLLVLALKFGWLRRWCS